MLCRYIIHVLSLWCILAPSWGQTLNQSATLMSDLLTGYDRRLRPILDQSKPVVVNMTFEAITIRDFDEIQGKFSVVGQIHLAWSDEKLQWNPASYGGIISQLFTFNDVWYPSLVLTNNYDNFKNIGNSWNVMRAYANGYAFSFIGEIYEATCGADLTYYPFDTQRCQLVFMSWDYTRAEINLMSTTDIIRLTYYSENGEWDLIETSALYLDYGSDAVSFSFKIKRKPAFLVINVILPIIIMLVINILVFVLPAESGERLSFSVTVLLAQAVFLTVVGDNLPKTSSPMSILSYFLMVCLILSTLMCGCVILNLRLYHKDNEAPVPARIAAVTRALKCVKVKVKSKLRNKTKNIHISDTTQKMEQPKMVWIPDDDNSAEEKAVTWQDVSFLVDTICITFFFFTIVIIVSIVMSILVNNKQ